MRLLKYINITTIAGITVLATITYFIVSDPSSPDASIGELNLKTQNGVNNKGSGAVHAYYAYDPRIDHCFVYTFFSAGPEAAMSLAPIQCEILEQHNIDRKSSPIILSK